MLSYETYLRASNILFGLMEKRGSLESLCLSSSMKKKKLLYALVLKSYKNLKTIRTIMKNCELSANHLKDECLLIVAIHDFLFSNDEQTARRVSFLFPAIGNIREKLLDEAKILKKEYKHPRKSELPKYARINGLKTNIDDVIRRLICLGYEEKVGNDPKAFRRDEIIPNLLCFSSEVEFHLLSLVKEGFLIVQDRASCIPAYILNPPIGSTVLDCCAAPGNKTSQLCAIMENSGTLLAVEKSRKRYKILLETLRRIGATNVISFHLDFLDIDYTNPPFCDVEYLLVDPTCSGSGMVRRMEIKTIDGFELNRLYEYQKDVLSRALSFPKVKSVVYSTCSIYSEENERVICDVLKEYKSSFYLEENILPNWKTRGIFEYCKEKDCATFIRSNPDTEFCGGFFIAKLNRRFLEKN